MQQTCRATTRNGTRCSRRVKEGQEFCWQHKASFICWLIGILIALIVLGYGGLTVLSNIEGAISLIERGRGLAAALFVVESPTQRASETPTPVPTATEERPTPSSTPTATPTALPTLAPTPTLSAGFESVSVKDGMIQVYVPAGETWIGSEENEPNAEAHEFPGYKVSIPEFWMDKTEVTNSMYQKCVEARMMSTPAAGEDPIGCPVHSEDFLPDREITYHYNPAFADYPVINISWFAAKDYCQWAGRSLPSEEEWERAARGSDGRTYPWGNAKPSAELANYAYSQSVPRLPAKVGAHPHGASPFGVLDMAGNVLEWTATWFAAYSGSEFASPMYGEVARVAKGGSYASWAPGIRSAIRMGTEPDKWSMQIGFRCASDQAGDS